MKKTLPLLVLPALLCAGLALSACDNKTSPVVVVPPGEPASVPVPVPGPPGPQGQQGQQGQPGEPGKTGDGTTVVVVPPTPPSGPASTN